MAVFSGTALGYLLVIPVALVAFPARIGQLYVLLLAATFVTRPRIDLFGAGVRVEHILAVLLAFRLLTQDGRRRALHRNSPLSRALALLLAFVAWNAVVSLLRAPHPALSMRIVLWLLIDVVIFALVALYPSSLRRYLGCGIRLHLAASSAALLAWGAAQANISTYGVQTDHVTGALAVYGLSYEANILASTLALWVLVALCYGGGVSLRQRRLAVILGSGALLVALTRAAVAATLLGMLTWYVMSRPPARTVARRVLMPCALLLVALWPLWSTAKVFEKNAEMFAFGSSTGQHRVEDWKLAAADLSDLDLLVGLGTNSFGQRHFDRTLDGSPTPAYLGNLPLQVLYDSGLIGLLLLFSTVRTLLPRSREGRAQAAALLVAYTTAGVATSPLWFGTTWVLLGAAAHAARTEQARARRPSPSALPAYDA